MNPKTLLKALNKVAAAAEGVGQAPVAMGALAHQTWGAKQPAERIDLLVPAFDGNRDKLLSAVRGEGLQETSAGDPSALRLRYTDPKADGATVDVTLSEAASPYLKSVHTRAQRGYVLDVPMKLATCEDVIVLLAASTQPADRQTIVELLRAQAAKIDAPYIKQAGQAAGVFDAIKSAWQQAKQGS
jgi:hypothetical protein